MGNRSMFVGLDVHKETVDVSIAEGHRNGEVRHYGVIASVSSRSTRSYAPCAARIDLFRLCNHAVVDVVTNSRQMQTTHPGKEMFRARAPTSGWTEMREDARSSSSRIAFGAFGRLRRHHCSAARICVFEIAYFDVERSADSLLRSSESTSVMGVVSGHFSSKHGGALQPRATMLSPPAGCKHC
jgi:hypothetical protein